MTRTWYNDYLSSRMKPPATTLSFEGLCTERTYQTHLEIYDMRIKILLNQKLQKNSSVESLYSVYQTQILLIASRYNNVPREDGEFVNNLQYITLV